MEGQNSNNVGNNTSGNTSNQNGQNGQYTFFNMKDDHGFNDHITSKVEDTKKALTKRLVIILAVIIVSIVTVIAFTNMLKKPKTTITNTYNSMVETRNQIRNRIQDLRN